MEKILKILTKVLILIISLSAFIYYINLDFYKTLIREDGIVEYFTAFMLLVSSIFIFMKIINLWSLKNTKWIIFNSIIMLGLFFGFGEEISWGQRLFSIESVKFFTENNSQQETNLHNLMINGVKLNKIIFSYGFTIIFGFYFLFSLFLFKKSKYFKNIIYKYGIVIPKMQDSIIFIVASIIITSIPESRRWELWECVFSLTLFLVLLQPYNFKEKLLVKIKD